MNGNDLVSVIVACNKGDLEIAVKSGGKELKIVGVDVTGDKITLTVEG